MSQSEFDPKPSLMVGDTADIALHRSISVLRNEGVNPVVTMDFTSTAAGVFCGINEIKSLLNKVLPESNRNVWAIQEGSDISDQELVLQVTAPYNSFAVYETAITGIMSHCTGWATASRECVEAAAGVPVISTGSSIVHPHVAGIMDYSAVVGGCVSCTTTLGSKLAGINPSGAISPNVILLIGDAVMAMQNFDKNMPQELPRMAPVNVIKDELEETLALARVMGQRLRGVILDATASVSPTKVKELRARLSLSGYPHVEILVRGNISAEEIRLYSESGVSVNAFGVADYISAASPLEFKANISKVDDQPAARRGNIPGSGSNPRLINIIQ